MQLQLTLHLPKVSAAEVGPASSSVESLFGKAQGIQLGGSILAVTAMIVGALVLTFGFRLIRAALFIVGFVVGGVAIAMIAERLFRDETWVILASWIAFGVGGLLCGAAVTWLYPLSTFVAGAATGVITGMILTNSFGYIIYPGHTKDLLTLMCVVLGLLFGVLALKVGKPILIISTSLFGSAMVVWGVGYFVGDFPNANDLDHYASEDINGDTVYEIPAAWWGYLAGILVLFIFGMFIQFRKTARNVKDNRPKGFGKRVDVAEYVEKKTARNQNQDSVDMEAPPPRRQRERRQTQPVREFQQVREVRQAPRKQRSKMQTPPPQYSKAPRQQYADLNATDEIIEYEERMPHQKRIVYSERESDLYEFDSYREPCRICGDYVHRDSSTCSEKIVRIERL
ncbi:Transmembrane protein 198 [Phytophthora citrophthora]|uniref:Transmembrane protein 198 n=1 Tax=Phytophthora citrophthora TaxID=4793 RepID=A0AAD9GTH6_9STRA|nr:Transmembrane protein 198 [Phytophthora citrophthora]